MAEKESDLESYLKKMLNLITDPNFECQSRKLLSHSSKFNAIDLFFLAKATIIQLKIESLLQAVESDFKCNRDSVLKFENVQELFLQYDKWRQEIYQADDKFREYILNPEKYIAPSIFFKYLSKSIEIAGLEDKDLLHFLCSE